MVAAVSFPSRIAREDAKTVIGLAAVIVKSIPLGGDGAGDG